MDVIEKIIELLLDSLFLAIVCKVYLNTFNFNGFVFQIYRFFRAVSYRWLARWLFGPLGWENTRPLPSCLYHKLRTQFHTHETTGYVSGQERANEND